jgi:hypothetical protein
MSFTVKGICQHGELEHRRKTSEAALKKARETSRTGRHEIHIVTPEGRDYASSEFGDLPRTPVAERPISKTRAYPMAGSHQHTSASSEIDRATKGTAWTVTKQPTISSSHWRMLLPSRTDSGFSGAHYRPASPAGQIQRLCCLFFLDDKAALWAFFSFARGWGAEPIWVVHRPFLSHTRNR